MFSKELNWACVALQLCNITPTHNSLFSILIGKFTNNIIVG